MAKKTGLTLILVLLFLVIIPITEKAESQSTITTAYIIYGIDGEIKNNLLRITWYDSLLARGPVYIYRSNQPFEKFGENPELMGRPAEVPYGTESFVDEIEEAGTYYYFAVASNEDGKQLPYLSLENNYKVFNIASSTGLPGSSRNNFTGTADGLSGQTVRQAESLVNIASVLPERIKTEVLDNTIIISFGTRIPDQAGGKARVILYRSVTPIKMTADLVNAIMVNTDVSSPYTDQPVPGIPYFYAVINDVDLLRGRTAIVPGINSTLFATTVPVVTNPAGQGMDGFPARTLPLPPVTLTAAGYSAIEGRNERVSPITLNTEAVKTLENINAAAGNTKDKTGREAVKLNRSSEIPAEGERYILDSIVNGSFTQKKWNECRDELRLFLSQPRSKTAAAHAKFYLGQCLFFIDAPREAFFEFLTARTALPGESSSWIEACIELIKDF